MIEFEDVRGLVLGGGMGLLLGALLMVFFDTEFGIVPDYLAAKAACEKELPRNQVCVMTFIPKVH